MLSREIERFIEELKKTKGKKECLKKAYTILTRKFKGERVKTYTRFVEVFDTELNEIWKKKFIHCTTMNYLLKKVLVKSGWFKEEDIKTKWTLVWCISPHQYAQVRIKNEVINVDCWGKAYGIPFRKYAHSFNQHIFKREK